MPQLIVKLDLGGSGQAHMAQRDPCPCAVVDDVEGDDAGRRERLRGPLPGEADVLRRIEGEDLADGLRIPHLDAQLATDTRLELGPVQPAAQSVGRGNEREDERTRRIDLGLQLNPIVHSAGPLVCEAARGRKRNHAQKATDTTAKPMSRTTMVANEVRVESAR